jgi:hypothetical protein
MQLRELMKATFGGFLMLADLAIGDGKLFPELKVFRVDDRFVVESSEDQLALIVTVVDAHPHPFIGKTLNLAVEFDFYEIAALVPGHIAPLPPYL